MTATQSSTINISVKRLKEYSSPFSSRFLKENLLVPKVFLGVRKKMREKTFLKGKPI